MMHPVYGVGLAEVALSEAFAAFILVVELPMRAKWIFSQIGLYRLPNNTGLCPRGKFSCSSIFLTNLVRGKFDSVASSFNAQVIAVVKERSPARQVCCSDSQAPKN